VEDTVALNALIDQIVTIEKSMHATVVNFVRARCWNTGSGSQAGNQMRVDRNLSGAGSATNIDFMDRERAFLIRWPAGINSRGKPVYLRKWFHTCGIFGAISLANSVYGNTSSLTTATGDAVKAKGDALQTLTASGVANVELCAQTGRQRTGNAQVHPYLEHHQLGDQWR